MKGTRLNSFEKFSAGEEPRLSAIRAIFWDVGGVLLTFNFVAVGWVFFALPEPANSIHFLRVLTGLG